jgi:ABC-2 type transport system permease protein
MAKLFVSSLKMLYRDKQALFWALMFPIIFAVVFGLFDLDSGPPVNVGVVVEQPSSTSHTILASLGEVKSFDVQQYRSEAKGRAALASGKQDVVLVVPRPGESVARLYYNGTAVDRNGTALGAIERVIQGINLEAVKAPPAVKLETKSVSARTVKYYDFLLPGLVAMGVMNFSITGMAIAISRFREQRILKRILATPLAPARFLTAQVLARLVLCVVQASLILAVGVFVFGAHVYGNLLWIYVLATLANLVFLNIGFAVAGRAPNTDAAQGIAQAVSIPMMFLSGVFFPTGSLPKVLQKAVEYLPLTPLIKALRKVSVDGASITATGSQIALIGAWIVVSFVLARRNFRFARA